MTEARRPKRTAKPSGPKRAARNGNGHGAGQRLVPARGLHVLHLITRLDRGGSAENTLLTVIGLGRMGYRVTLAAGDSFESHMTARERAALEARLAEARSAGVRQVLLPSLRRAVSPWSDLMALREMAALIRSIKPDVVHTHTSKAGVLGRLAAWFCRVPVVVHTPHGHIFYGYYGSMVTAVIVALERGLGRITHGLITLTDVGKKDYIARKIIAADRLHAIPSGIDLSAYRNGASRPARPGPSRPSMGNGHAHYGRSATGESKARRAIGLPVQALIIGIMGRLVPIKGHRYLIDALPAIRKEFPSACLLFVGEGEERDRLAGQAAGLGVAEHVHLVGAQAELRRHFAACNIIVQPSLNEGMGRTVVEALAMGRPVIASRVGGLPELIQHGRNGLLVPPGDSAALAGAVRSLLRDPARRRRMGETASLSVTNRYTTEAMVAAIEQLYLTLCRRLHPTAVPIASERRRTESNGHAVTRTNGSKPSRERSRASRIPSRDQSDN